MNKLLKELAESLCKNSEKEWIKALLTNTIGGQYTTGTYSRP